MTALTCAKMSESYGTVCAPQSTHADERPTVIEIPQYAVIYVFRTSLEAYCNLRENISK